MKKLFACVISALCLFAVNAVMAESISSTTSKGAGMGMSSSSSKSSSVGVSQQNVTMLTGAVGTTFTDVGSGGSTISKNTSISQGAKAGKGISTTISESVNVRPAAAVPGTDGIVVGAATVVRCVTMEQGPKSESVCESRLMTNEDADAIIKAVEILNGTKPHRTLSIGSASLGGTAVSMAMSQSNQVTK